MTLDEAIIHVIEVAEENDKLCKRYDDASGYTRSHNEDIRTTDAKKCEACAEEHRQLAEWLKDYKRLLSGSEIPNKSDNGDLISRQATLNAIIKRLGIKDESYLLEAERLLYQQILAMPSAEKIGHWIEKMDACECPYCHKAWDYCDNDTEDFDYCPKCGAKMSEIPTGSEPQNKQPEISSFYGLKSYVGERSE